MGVSTYLRRATQKIGPEAMSLDLDQIVHHYYSTFTSANPKEIIPIGYRKDFLDGGKESYVDPKDVPTEYSQGGEEQDQANAEERRSKGEFVRGVSAFRHWLGGEDFPLEEGRYVLFVANNCPWCHRTLLARSFYPGVDKVVRTSVMFYRRGEEGWRFLPTDDNEFKIFEKDRPGLLTGMDGSDPTNNGFTSAKEIYRLCLTQRQSASLATRAPTLSKCLPGLEDWTFLRGLLWPIPSRKSMHVSTRTSTTERTVQVSPVTKNRTRMPRRTIFAR